MSKPFFEVFPTLKVQKDLKSFFEETRVERLTSNHERTRLKVSLRSDHLIHKSRIYRMQDEISGQLFTERRVQVYLDEHFEIPAGFGGFLSGGPGDPDHYGGFLSEPADV